MTTHHLWYNANLFGHPDADALSTFNGKITWIGRASNVRLDDFPQRTDVQNKWILPGFIDCHTHAVFGGNRAHEFFLRQSGASYEEIAKAGGGILNTVKHTRALSQEALFLESLPRVRALQKSGITSIEIKSGYGLTLQDEIKMLKAAECIEKELSISVYPTFLGAHSVPPEFSGKSDHYVDYICAEMIPAVTAETRAHALDVFCERIAFSIEQTERLFQCAQQHGLKIKCHAEQLSHMGAAALSAKYGALSADHLEYADITDVLAMKQYNTVSVLLPGAFYFLQEKKRPPIDLLREHHVPIAIATDCNPGTSPLCSILIAMNLAVVLFKLSWEEVIAGVTLHAARALGIQDQHGSLDVGKSADFCVWNIHHPQELVYYLGSELLHHMIKNGEVLL